MHTRLTLRALSVKGFRIQGSGENQLPKVVQGVTFRNGVEVTNTPAQNAA